MILTCLTMNLLGQVIFIAICVYAASGARLTGVDNGLVDAVDNGANSAANAAHNAENAAANKNYNAANAVNAAGNAAALNATYATTNAGHNEATTSAKHVVKALKNGNFAIGNYTKSNWNLLNSSGSFNLSNTGHALTANDCFASYTFQIGLINNEIVNMTQCRNKNVNGSLANNTENANYTLALVNILSMDLQNRLAYCGALNTTENVLICYTETFDANIMNLDKLTVKSQMALAYMSGNTSSVEMERKSCVSSVILLSKLESICCLNTLQFCLEIIPAS